MIQTHVHVTARTHRALRTETSSAGFDSLKELITSFLPRLPQYDHDGRKSHAWRKLVQIIDGLNGKF